MTTRDILAGRESLAVERHLREVRAALARLAEHPLAGLDDETRDALDRVAVDFVAGVRTVLAGLRRADRAARGLPADAALVDAEERLMWAEAYQAEAPPGAESAWAAGRVWHARSRVLRAGGVPVAHAVRPPALRPELLRLVDSLDDHELEVACGDILAAVSAAQGDPDGWVGYGPRADRARVP